MDTLEGLLVTFFKKLKNKKVLLHTESEKCGPGGVNGGHRGPKFFSGLPMGQDYLSSNRKVEKVKKVL